MHEHVAIPVESTEPERAGPDPATR
jgi:hypothetical protein